MYWFTADFHLGHRRIIEYCNRPFSSVEEMDETLITNHNEVVDVNDVVVHAGDFCWCRSLEEAHKRYIQWLKGNHIFLKGSHDGWLPDSARRVWHKTIEGQFVVVCHWAMRVWERSHYGSWQLYGHSHGNLSPIGLQYDIGVDGNEFYPYSFEDIKSIMAIRGENQWGEYQK